MSHGSSHYHDNVLSLYYDPETVQGWGPEWAPKSDGPPASSSVSEANGIMNSPDRRREEKEGGGKRQRLMVSGGTAAALPASTAKPTLTTAARNFGNVPVYTIVLPQSPHPVSAAGPPPRSGSGFGSDDDNGSDSCTSDSSASAFCPFQRDKYLGHWMGRVWDKHHDMRAMIQVMA